MIARMREWWNEFFLAEEVPYGMALVRITLPLVLLVPMLQRWPHVRELYSTDGAPSPLWLSYGTAPLLPDLSPAVAMGLFSLSIFTLITSSLGWKTRTSLAISTVLFASFGILDMVSTLTKYTVLASHALLLLACSGCGKVWSVDVWLSRSSTPVASLPRPLTPVWPRRLLQLLLAFCYLGAAFTKMHTPAYFSGDQMQFWMLANMNFANPVGEYLSLFPPISIIAAYLTILWEVLFIALIWRRPLRNAVLAIGVVFHIMSWLMLGLIVFPLVCGALYLIFIDEDEGDRLAVWLKSFQLRLSPPAWVDLRTSVALFAMLAATFIVTGIEVEHRMDVYGEHGPNGPLPLKVVDDASVQAMLGTERSIEPRDFFFAFDVGTTTIGGVLADRRSEFATGETAILQCSMTPPHPDMWVEVSLEDSDEHVLRKFGQIVPRETLRSDFTYQFDNVLTPGEYAFVVNYNGTEVARRRFRYRFENTDHQPYVQSVTNVR